MANQAIQEAIHKAGSQIQLAKAIGVTQGMISRYLYDHYKPSPEQANKIQKLYQIPRMRIRPDIFGEP